MGAQQDPGPDTDLVTVPRRVRITRDDFPAPPELADRDPARAPGEHVGGLRAELRWRDGRLALGRTYFQNPLRIYEALNLRPGDPGLLYLINSTAGLLDGDGQLVELEVRPGVRAFVTNQSASRIHPCPEAHASARYDLSIQSGAVLCCLPGPTIPFTGSRFYQSIEIRLEPGANVVWGDILLPGRVHYDRGPERFAFEQFIQALQVRREGVLVFHERFAWSGPWTETERLWHFGPFDASASLFISGPMTPEELPAPDGLEVAWQTTAWGDTCVRLVGQDPEVVIATAARLAFAAASRLAGDPAPWFAGSHLLASSNHWFSQPPTA